MNGHAQGNLFFQSPRGISFTVLLTAASVFSGCSESEHEATQTVRDYLEAKRYGDLDRAFGLHTESVKSQYCTSTFNAVMEAARKEGTPVRCAPLVAREAAGIEAVEDEIRLYLQVLHVICRHPGATCQDYAKEVFAHSFGAADSPSDGPVDLRLHRVVGSRHLLQH